jgi:hypothetical protein
MTFTNNTSMVKYHISDYEVQKEDIIKQIIPETCIIDMIIFYDN